MAITVEELKKFLSETIAQDFTKEGFSFNKSQFSFLKKFGQNKVRCSFLFYHFNTYQEFHFTFYFTIAEIENELKRLWAFYSESYSTPFTFLISEGDFHPKTRNELSKYRMAYTDRVFDIENSFSTIDECRALLKNEFFTRIPSFTNLTKFQEYILSNYKEVVELLLIWPALIALLLHSKEELNNFISYLTTECNSKYLPDKSDLNRMIKNVEQYCQSNL